MRLTLPPKSPYLGHPLALAETTLERLQLAMPGNAFRLNDADQKSPRVATFTIRTATGKSPAARTSATGRRINSANWEAHRVFMEHLFGLEPDARLKTAVADYQGKADFLAKFDDTYAHNVGSQIRPVSLGGL